VMTVITMMMMMSISGAAPGQQENRTSSVKGEFLQHRVEWTLLLVCRFSCNECSWCLLWTPSVPFSYFFSAFFDK
jgi:hypothetical protein